MSARAWNWIDSVVLMAIATLLIVALVMMHGCNSGDIASPNRTARVATSQPVDLDQSLAGIRTELNAARAQLAEFEVGLRADVRAEVTGIKSEVTKSYGDNDRWSLRMAILGCIVLPVASFLLGWRFLEKPRRGRRL